MIAKSRDSVNYTVGEEKITLSSTLLGSVSGALQIEMTKRLTGKKAYFIYIWDGSTTEINENLKKVVRP